MYISKLEDRRVLREVALGLRHAEMVVKNGRLVNVHTSEIQENCSIAIAAGRIAYVGDCSRLIGDATVVIDAENSYLVPGLIDGHMHVESTMLTVTEFARIALVHGTTAIFMDPHEIGNVLGIQGVKLMHQEGQGVLLKVFTTIPSCVPSVPALEDSGFEIRKEEVESGLSLENVVGLSEMMDFSGVIAGDAELWGKIEATLAAGKIVTGHLPTQEESFIQAYISAGISSDHECTSSEEALLKARLGMTIMIREGSAWQDVKQVVKLITEHQVDHRACLLVTDDVDAKTLMEFGHMNHVVRRAIEEGVNPISAIQMATLQTAQHFHVESNIGSIAPGKCADILVIDDLTAMIPRIVVVNGVTVAINGELIVALQDFVYPEDVRNSVRLLSPLHACDFQIHSGFVQQGTTNVRVIQVIENSAITKSTEATLTVNQGVLQPDVQQDVILLASIERHNRSGQKALGLVKGFGLKSGAVASTVAHDSHNLLIMGVSPVDMAVAANFLHDSGGGLVVVQDEKILAHVRLPIAGLMSDQSVQVVKDEITKLEAAWQELGCRLHAPFMTFSLLALPVIPQLRLTNRGLVDVILNHIIPLEIGNK